jgi:UrcA family protein
MKTFTQITTTVLTAVVLSSAVQAQNENFSGLNYDTKSMSISLLDTNLTNPVEAKNFLDQLRRTVSRVCSRNESRDRLAADRDRDNCVNNTFTRTVASINTTQGFDVEAIAAIADQPANIVSVD